MAGPRAYADDAILQFQYEVTLSGGYTFGRFSEVTGLSVEYEEARYPSADGKQIQKIPGRREIGDVTCRKGVVRDTTLIKEFVKTADPRGSRVEVTITLKDRTGRDIRTWVLQDAWVKRWEGPELDGSSSEVAVESVVFACEDII